MSNQNNKDNMETVAMRVCIVSIFGNTILSLIKLLAGVIAHSGAMVSDAVHSASDVFSSIIVIVGVKLSAQASDKEHPYGHERLECIAALLLANILCLTGIGIGYGAVKNIIAGDYAHLQTPGLLAAAAAILSIISKEAMFQYTKYHAKRVDSGALMADAWHHRSDAFSSVGALIGIVGARLGFPVLDSIASVVICLFMIFLWTQRTKWLIMPVMMHWRMSFGSVPVEKKVCFMLILCVLVCLEIRSMLILRSVQMAEKRYLRHMRSQNMYMTR